MARFSKEHASDFKKTLPKNQRLKKAMVKQILEDHSKKKPLSKYMTCTRKQAIVYGFKYYRSESPCDECGSNLRKADTCACVKCIPLKRKPSNTFKREDYTNEIISRISRLKATNKPNNFIDHDTHVTMFIDSKVHGTVQVKLDVNDYYKKIRKYRWYIIPKGNGKLVVACCSGVGITVKLHQVIMNDKFIDHKNGDTLDNRRKNLRPCDYSLNRVNTDVIQGEIPYKGVCMITSKRGTKSYRSLIAKAGTRYYLGSFSSPIKAAVAYDHALAMLYRERVALNRDVAKKYTKELSTIPSEEISKICRQVEQKIRAKSVR